MLARNLAYWSTTALFALVLGAGGLADFFLAEPMVEGMAHLGFPVYVASILGFWKIVGAIAVVVPLFPKLKEWAYAGFFFNLTGAAAAHWFVGDGLGGMAFPLALLGLGAASYLLRPPRLKTARAPETVAEPVRLAA